MQEEITLEGRKTTVELLSVFLKQEKKTTLKISQIWGIT